MRLCASLFRGVAAPLGCVIFFYFCRNCDFYALRSGLSARAKEGVASLPSVRFACCRNAGRPLVKTTHLPFSWSGYFFVDFSGINYAPIRNLENLKTVLIFSIACGMVVLLEIKPLHGSYYVGKL